MRNADEGEQTTQQAKQQLTLANEEWITALAQQDETALNRIMAESFVMAYPFEGDDKEQFIADIVAGEIKVQSLQAHEATVRVVGDAGIVFGSETANWHYRGRDLSGLYRFIRIYTQQHGKWQIIALHLCFPHR